MESVLLPIVLSTGASLIAYLVWSVKRSQSFMEKLVSNHLSHNTKALEDLAQAIDELNIWLRDRK